MPKSRRNSPRKRKKEEEEPPPSSDDEQDTHALSKNSRIVVQASYLERHSNQKDLIRRLTALWKVLQDSSIEADSPEWPGLSDVATALPAFCAKSNPTIRLYATASALEVLAIFAPQVPFASSQDTITVLRATGQCLAQLAIQQSPDVLQRMLDVLANAQMGALLADSVLSETVDEDDDDDDDDGLTFRAVLSNWFATLLSAVRPDQSSAWHSLVVRTLSPVFDEYENHPKARIPAAILEELLTALGTGPTILKLVPGSTAKNKPTSVPQSNPTYNVAATLLKQHAELLAPALSNHCLQQWQDSSTTTRLDNAPPTEESDNTNLYTIIPYMINVVPQVLLPAMTPTLVDRLGHMDAAVRKATCRMWGRISHDQAAVWRAWWGRAGDADAQVRQCVVEQAIKLLHKKKQLENIERHLSALVAKDPARKVRQTALEGICKVLRKTSVPEAIMTPLLEGVARRLKSKDHSEGKEAVLGLAAVYAKHRATEEDAVSWIPTSIFQAVHLRSTLVHVLDHVLVQGKNVDELADGWIRLTQDVAQHDPGTVHLRQLLEHRYEVQAAVSRYLDSRRTVAEADPDSEEALAEGAQSWECLQTVAALLQESNQDKVKGAVLKQFHNGIVDRHVWRLLASIATSSHSSKNRQRAVSEIPKRVPPSVQNWATSLVEACSMGPSWNADVAAACIERAGEADDSNTAVACVKACRIVDTSVPLSNVKTLVELVVEPEESDAAFQSEALALLNASAKEINWDEGYASGLESRLEDVCLSSGSWQQAQFAVETLSFAWTGDDTSPKSLVRQLATRFEGKNLASASVEDHIRALSTLAAISKQYPDLLVDTKGGKAVTSYAINLWKGKTPEGKEKTPSKRRLSHKSHATPKGREEQVFDDQSLSAPVRRLYASASFLVSVIRSRILACVASKEEIEPPSFTMEVFKILDQVLQGQGTLSAAKGPLANRQDRAALRQCASIQMLRLCDTRLKLETRCVSPAMWQTLSQSLLDEETAVRETVMKELSHMLQGTGVYGLQGSPIGAMAPSLRFLAMICLCANADHGADSSNGNAANVSKAFIVDIRRASKSCIVNLRKASDSTFNQCRAQGPAAVERFEKQFKMRLMPEYMVPYAIHLLSHRTESSTSNTSMDFDEVDEFNMGLGDDDATVDDSIKNKKVLQKRLKLIFEQLIESLGDNADNISFLIRMVDVLSQHYEPVDVSPFASSRSVLGSPSISSPALKRSAQLRERLQTTCEAARKVLLGFVKKDVNLTPYPGTINFPSALFAVSKAAPKSKQRKSSVSTPPVPRSILTDRMSSGKKRKSKEAFDSPMINDDAHVTFSPEVSAKSRLSRKTGKSPSRGSFGSMSPIERSPASAARTLGSTPPSALKNATLRSPTGTTTSEESHQDKFSSQSSSIVIEEVEPADSENDSDDEDLKTTSETPEPSPKRARGSRSRKVPVKESSLKKSSSDKDFDMSDSDDDEENVSQKPQSKRRRGASTAKSPAPGKKSVPKKKTNSKKASLSITDEFDMDESDLESAPSPKRKPKPATKKIAPKKKAPVKKTTKKTPLKKAISPRPKPTVGKSTNGKKRSPSVENRPRRRNRR